MNKHIELVKKWLADSKSVTQKELEDNRKAAYDAWAAWAADDARAAYWAAESAYWAADEANAEAALDDVAYWVKRYEEFTENLYQVRFQLRNTNTKHPFRVATVRHGIGESVPMGSIEANGDDTHLTIDQVRKTVVFINNKPERYVAGCDHIMVSKIQENENGS